MIFLIFAFTFFSRALPRILYPRAVAADAYFHMYMAKKIRENKYSIPNKVPRAMLPNYYDYPFLYHLFLSIFPTRLIPTAERYTSAIFDTLYIALTYIFSLLYIPIVDPDIPTHSTALWIAAITSISPIFLKVGSGPSSFNGSPRPLGRLLVLIFLAATLLYPHYPNYQIELFVLGMLAVLTTAASSKFGIQFLVFGSTTALLFGQYLPILWVGAGLCVAVFPRLKILKIINGSINHSKFYYKYIQEKYLWPTQRNFRKYTLSLKNSYKNPSTFITWVFTERFTPHILFTIFINIPLSAVLIASQPNPSFIYNVILWLVIGLILMILTTMKKFMFLGEPERYLEYTHFLQMFIFGYLCIKHDYASILWTYLAYSFLVYLLFIRIFSEQFSYWINVNQVLIKNLKKIDKATNVIYYLGNLWWPVLYGTEKAQILCNGGNIHESEFPPELFEEVQGNNPFPGVPLQKIIEKYHVTHVVMDYHNLERYKRVLKDFNIEDDFKEKLFEEKDFFIIKV